LTALSAGRPLSSRKIPGTHFCLRLCRRQGHNAAGRIRSIEKPNDLIGIRTRDLPACSIVPHPTTLPHDIPFIRLKVYSIKSLGKSFLVSSFYQFHFQEISLRHKESRSLLELKYARHLLHGQHSRLYARNKLSYLTALLIYRPFVFKS
jgi:hypothetical protein